TGTNSQKISTTIKLEPIVSIVDHDSIVVVNEKDDLPSNYKAIYFPGSHDAINIQIKVSGGAIWGVDYIYEDGDSILAEVIDGSIPGEKLITFTLPANKSHKYFNFQPFWDNDNNELDTIIVELVSIDTVAVKSDLHYTIIENAAHPIVYFPKNEAIPVGSPNNRTILEQSAFSHFVTVEGEYPDLNVKIDYRILGDSNTLTLGQNNDIKINADPEFDNVAELNFSAYSGTRSLSMYMNTYRDVDEDESAFALEAIEFEI
ncbi:MAG: hypothetical protein OCD76_25395, partial [Reichenbachiella sp.]